MDKKHKNEAQFRRSSEQGQSGGSQGNGPEGRHKSGGGDEGRAAPEGVDNGSDKGRISQKAVHEVDGKETGGLER